MAALDLLERPRFQIGALTYSDEEVYDFLNRPGMVYTTANPLVGITMLRYVDPNDARGYNPNSNSRSWPDETAHPQYLGLATRHQELAGNVWVFQPRQKPYYGYGSTEDYFATVNLRGGKFLGIRIGSTGANEIEPFGPISRGFSIGSDFLPGAIATVAVAVGLHGVGELIAGAGAGVAGSATVMGPTDFELATGGMGTGMGTATVITPVTAVEAGVGAVSATEAGGITWAQAAGAGKTIVDTIGQAAKVVTTVSAAAKVIQNTAAGGQGSGGGSAPANNPPTDPAANNNLIYMGAALVALMVLT